MSGPNSATNFPICFTIKLISFNKDGAGGLRGRQDHHISRNAFLRMNFYYITNPDPRRINFTKRFPS